MAKSHYSADSASLPPLSLRPGLPGSRNEDPAKTVDFPALSLDDATPLPANYLLADAANVCVGASAHGARLPNRTIGAEPGLSGPSPTTTND